MPPPRIVVFGGSGFLGSHICRAAIQRNCLVTSISRSGAPANHDTSVTFEKGDIFTPEQYRDVLRGATAVVYSAGMLLEGEYKGLVSGEFDVLKVVGLLGRKKSRNPLEADPKYPRGYDALNRDGAILVAKEAANAGVPIFTFISAAANFPLVPSRYVTSKREAESAISQIEGLRSIFIRPGLMYSSTDRPHLQPITSIISTLSILNSRLNNSLPLGAAALKPLDVTLVARAVIAATLNPSITGIIEIPTIESLASS